MNRVAIVDYGMCNLDSVRRAVEECGAPVRGDARTPSSARRTASSCPASARSPTRWTTSRARTRPSADRRGVGEGSRSSASASGCSSSPATASRAAATDGLGWIDGEVVRLDPRPTSSASRTSAGTRSTDRDGHAVRRDRVRHGLLLRAQLPRRVSLPRRRAATTPYCGGFTSAVSRRDLRRPVPPGEEPEGRLPGAAQLRRGLSVLKMRVIPTLLYKDFGLVKGGVRLATRRRQPDAGDQGLQPARGGRARVLRHHRHARGRSPDFELIDDLADECFMPLTVGGGVRTIEDVRGLLQVGADKVCLGPPPSSSPTSSTKRRAVRLAVRRRLDRRQARRRRSAHGLDPVRHRRHRSGADRGRPELEARVRERSCSVDRPRRDDDRLRPRHLRAVCDAVSVPVVASGGAGTYEHMLQAVESAVHRPWPRRACSTSPSRPRRARRTISVRTGSLCEAPCRE